MAEWLKAHDSKSCGRVTVSEVRILSLPPNYDTKMLDDMEGTDEMRRTVLELIKEHKGDLGGITWMEEK